MTMGVLIHFHRIVTHFRNRRFTFNHCVATVGGRRIERARHALNITHRPADHIGGHFKTESIPRLK